MNKELFDVVVVGAGLAGSICAKQLQEIGYRVLVLDKSRGVGGRAATRRREDLRIDHGLQYLKIQPEPTPALNELLQQLLDCQIIESWTGNVYELNAEGLQATPPATRYVAPEGMSAIAKFFTKDLQVQKKCLVRAIAATEAKAWQISYHWSDGAEEAVLAKTVVIAIPAPQALPILQSSPAIPTEFISQLNAVEYSPCIAVMAGYSQDRLQDLPSWQAVKITSDRSLAWIALDSNKRKITTQPVFVLHSTAQFAQNYEDETFEVSSKARYVRLETTDLKKAAEKLLHSAANLFLPWLDRPEWFQVHKWRYALTVKSLSVSHLSTIEPLPLVCCGDWCGGFFAESAMRSGIAAANEIDNHLTMHFSSIEK
jgi:renalase